MINRGIGRFSMLASLAVAFLTSVARAAEVREILPDTVSIGSAIVSGDGSRVAFTRSDGLSMQLFLASTDGSEIRQLTQYFDSDPLHLESISELGNIVAFTKPVSGVTQIFIATETSYVSQLTSRSRPSTQPRLNADGSRIFFQRDSLNAPGVYVMDGFGGGAELVSISPASVVLGNTGRTGNRIGGRLSTTVGNEQVNYPVSIERLGPDLPLWTIGANFPEPRLSADEQWYALAEAFSGYAVIQVSSFDLLTSWTLTFWANSVHILGISDDGSRLLLDVDGLVQHSRAGEYFPTPAVELPFPVTSVTASDDLFTIAASRRVGNAKRGLWIVRHSPARIEAPSYALGLDPVPVEFVSPPDPDREYIAAASFGTTPGTVLADGRVVPLNPTELARVSSRPGSPIFVGFRGRLDVSGRASGEIRVPRERLPVGRVLHLAFVVLDPQASLGIGRISQPTSITFAGRR